MLGLLVNFSSYNVMTFESNKQIFSNTVWPERVHVHVSRWCHLIPLLFCFIACLHWFETSLREMCSCKCTWLLLPQRSLTVLWLLSAQRTIKLESSKQHLIIIIMCASQLIFCGVIKSDFPMEEVFFIFCDNNNLYNVCVYLRKCTFHSEIAVFNTSKHEWRKEQKSGLFWNQ